MSILLSPDPASSAFASLLPRDEAQQGGAYSLGSISHFELSPLPRSDKILSTPFRLYRCLAARQQNDTAAALEACGYDYLLSDRLNADFQLLRMRADTEWLWNVNSEVLHAQWKAYAAANASSLQLEARLLLVREQDSGRPAEVSATSRLNSSEAEAFWLAAARGRGGVPCANFFPKFVRLTATEPKLLTSDNDAWHTRQSLAFAISSATSASADGDGDGDNDSDAPPQRYWSLRQAAADPSPFGAAAGDGVQLVVAADRMIIPDDSPIAELAEGGIIAFYLVRDRGRSNPVPLARPHGMASSAVRWWCSPLPIACGQSTEASAPPSSRTRHRRPPICSTCATGCTSRGARRL